MTMDGDRDTISAFRHFEFELGETITQGGKVCNLVRSPQALPRSDRSRTRPVSSLVSALPQL